MATVLLGGNDIARPMFLPSEPVTEALKARDLVDFRRNLSALLDRLAADGVRVILFSPAIDRHGGAEEG